jgi:hypothetical protein
MARLLKRWYVWLGLFLLLGLSGSVALICSNPGRITHANHQLIRDGMTEEEVMAILGEHEPPSEIIRGKEILIVVYRWRDGPNWISVAFGDGKAYGSRIHIATTRETLKWYAKKGAAKIGINWD